MWKNEEENGMQPEEWNSGKQQFQLSKGRDEKEKMKWSRRNNIGSISIESLNPKERRIQEENMPRKRGILRDMHIHIYTLTHTQREGLCVEYRGKGFIFGQEDVYIILWIKSI